MILEDAKQLIQFCENKNIKSIKGFGFEVEFFPKQPDSMNMDPASLAKTLTDSMPPDSAMMFASTEDIEDTLKTTTRDNDMNT